MYVVNADTTDKWVDLNQNNKVDNGETFAPGATCFEFTTNASGDFTSANKLLQFGKYRVEE